MELLLRQPRMINPLDHETLEAWDTRHRTFGFGRRNQGHNITRQELHLVSKLLADKNPGKPHRLAVLALNHHLWIGRLRHLMLQARDSALIHSLEDHPGDLASGFENRFSRNHRPELIDLGR